MQTLRKYLKTHRCNDAPKTENYQSFGELYENTHAIYYDVPVKDGVRKVFAFVSVPTTRMPKGGYPAVVLLHGGKGMAYCEFTKVWADRGFVAIAPDLNGKCGEDLGRRSVDNPLGGPSGYGFNGIDETHPWAYFSTLSAMRAVDVLRARSDVNHEKICSCGLSWGGFLNLLLLSQDRRISAGSVIYSAAYTHESEWGKKQLAELSDEEKESYVRYIEPSNYLSDVRVPVLFTAGMDDIAFKAENRRKTAENISGKAYFALRKTFYHGNFYGFEQTESLEFFCKIFSNARVPQPTLRRMGKDEFFVRAATRTAQLQLLYTKEDVCKMEKQKWRAISVRNGEKLRLPKGTTALLVVEKTKNGVWSSEIICQ